MSKIIRSLVAAISGTLLLALPATAASNGGYTLFGDASEVSPGNNSPTAVQLVSDDDPGFGGVDFTIPEDLTFADLETLSTDYNVTDDDCSAGSPRYQLNTDEGNIFVYIGPSPTFTGCAPDWQTTGNLIGNNDACRYDTSQLEAGTQCNTYDGALAAFGDTEITGIQLVVDSGFASPDGEQTILVDNMMVNDGTTTLESKESCKDGGWQQFTADPGPFKNQGQCVSHFARQP